MTAAAGQYRLCWCTYAQSQLAPLAERRLAEGGVAPDWEFLNQCSSPEQFVVDFGAFTLVGVRPTQQDRTCISGQTCSLDGIIGVGLLQSDHFLVLDTCGTESVPPRFPEKIPDDSTALSVLTSGATVTWHVPVTASGGLYRLCWCSANAPSCSVGEHFRTDAGTLTIVGLSPLHQDTIHYILYTICYIIVYYILGLLYFWLSQLSLSL